MLLLRIQGFRGTLGLGAVIEDCVYGVVVSAPDGSLCSPQCVSPTVLPLVAAPTVIPSGVLPTLCSSCAPPVCSPHRAHFLCAPPSTWAAQMLLQGPSSSSRNWSLILPCVLFSGVQPQPPCPLPCPGSGVSLILPCLFLKFSPSRPSPSVLGPVSGVSSPVCFPGFSLSPPHPVRPGSGVRCVCFLR